MARYFLAVPASTGHQSLRLDFSCSDRIVSPHRNRRHPKTIKALMCVQSWLWGAELQGMFYCYTALIKIIALVNRFVTYVCFQVGRQPDMQPYAMIMN